MDFEGLFWIALIVFYFVTRVIGGKKNSKPSPRPTGERRQRPTGERQPRSDRSRTSTTGEPELDEALREIRRALGFPVEEPEPERPQAPEPTAGPERRPEPESRRSAKFERQRARDAREAARQKEMLERAREADEKRAPAIPKPKVARQPGPIGAHPMESSFAEEEMFERTGRHPHKEPPPDYALQAPYAASARRRRRIQRQLRGKESLRDAFVLKEVLDKPLSLRRRR